jgi:hypothetical protein
VLRVQKQHLLLLVPHNSAPKPLPWLLLTLLLLLDLQQLMCLPADLLLAGLLCPRQVQLLLLGWPGCCETAATAETAGEGWCPPQQLSQHLDVLECSRAPSGACSCLLGCLLHAVCVLKLLLLFLLLLPSPQRGWMPCLSCDDDRVC